MKVGQMFVTPGIDRMVRYPGSPRLLPGDGAVVPENTYWMRRVQDGDVVRHFWDPDAEPVRDDVVDEPEFVAGPNPIDE